MADKAELRFTGAGTAGQSISLRSGTAYLFRANRLGAYQVKVGSSAFDTARNFYEAFEQDDNYLGIFKVSLEAIQTETTDGSGNTIPGPTEGLVTIEHPDNDYFNITDLADFITPTLTTTPQEVEDTLTVTLSQASSDSCGRYKISVDSNNVGGKIVIKSPASSTSNNPEFVTDGTVKSIDLPRPSTAVKGAVLLYENNVLIKTTLFDVPPVLAITSVDIKGSPFGAVATINTNAGLVREYSLDNAVFQGSNTYTNLLTGSYTAYVRDSFGCVKSKPFEVTEAQASGFTVAPFINIPIHNSLRFAKRGANNFLSYLSVETPGHAQINRYSQDYLVGDVITTQFKSSYPTNRAFLIDENCNETELVVLQKSKDNIRRVNIYEGNITEREGRIAVYFTAGNIYNPDGSLQDEGHILNGTLPDWYEEGLYLNIEGIGVTVVERILEEDDVIYAITQKDSVPDVLGIKITSIHTAHPYEVFEFDLALNTEGRFQVKVDHGEGIFLSEPIQAHNELPDYLEVWWWSHTNNDILYNTGIRQFRRLQWDKYFTLIPRAEKETYDTDTSVELINSKTFAVYELIFEGMPMEVARGLETAFDNSDTIVINGLVFLCEEPMKLEPQGQWYYPSAQLTLVDQTMDGQQVVIGAVRAEFLAVEKDANGVSFLRLN